MDRDECIRLVRNGSAKFSASDVTISFPNASLAEDGFITSSDGRFRLSLRAPAKSKILALATGFVERKDFGTAQGVIDFSLPFRIRGVQPCSSADTINGNTILHFNFDRLDFSLERTTTKVTDVKISGLLLGYKLIAPEKRTNTTVTSAFLGKRQSWAYDTAEGKLTKDWSFGLIQRGDDIEFCIEKINGKPSLLNEEENIVRAFLASIAFIHGQHAWPFYLRHRRDGKYVSDWIRSPEATARSAHRPFSERIWFNARVGQIDWNFNRSLRRAFKFFVKNSPFVEEIEDLLQQTRDASEGSVHKKSNNVVLCALLESAITAIFENLVRAKKNSYQKAFENARKSALETLNEAINASSRSTEATALRRLRQKLSNTPFWHTREKFEAVANKLGLKWQKDWEDLYDFWARWRHRVIHRGTRAGEISAPDSFKIESRMAGAIYLLVLRVMGYRGIAIKSVLEDVFTKI